MSSSDAYDRIFSYYRDFLKHGDDARRVAWRAVHDQELRFENLLEALDDGVNEFSVLDVGCGLGDLFSYLERTGRRCRYHGVDIVPEMIEEAKKRHPTASFEVRDIVKNSPVESYDLVLCSGGMTVRTPHHERFVRTMLDTMLGCANLAVAVNFQSTRAFLANPLAREDEDLYHTDPMKLYRMCRELCRWSTLREDMLLSDVTVYMYPGHARSLNRYRRLCPDADPVGLAWLYLERRLPKEALALLDGAEASAARSNFQGMALQQLGRSRDAVKAYKEALELDASYEPARLNLQGIQGLRS